MFSIFVVFLDKSSICYGEIFQIVKNKIKLEVDLPLASPVLLVFFSQSATSNFENFLDWHKSDCIFILHK